MKKVNAKKVLIKFCQLKSRKIGKILNIQSNFYWGKEDTQWLNSLDLNICNLILKRLSIEIKEYKDFGLFTETCIPCLYKIISQELCYNTSHNHREFCEKVDNCDPCKYNVDCNTCNYNLFHGICDDLESDYRYIINCFKEDNIDEEEKLNNAFYVKILNKAYEGE